MHITRVELENIKSHENFAQSFERGTTAITGENGAGKTTIIEAIAWTLFDLLDYKKEEFIRRGAKKGIARVTFESSKDEREYTVYRDTSAGYYIYDPRLKIRTHEKKEEVKRFLWDHLGVEVGTDLESLFRRAIGVPQGTFTAIFLETATERKKAFDKLLKVEEYRQGAEKLLDTARFVGNEILVVREKIARAEGELARIDQVTGEHAAFENQAKELAKGLGRIEKEAAAKSDEVSRLDLAEADIRELKNTADRLQNEKARSEILVQQKRAELERSRGAAEKIKLAETDNTKHLAALARLRELEKERGERDKLRMEYAELNAASANVRADQKRFGEDLERCEKAHVEIEALRPQVKNYDELIKGRDGLRNKLADAQAKEAHLKSLDDKVKRLRESWLENSRRIKEAESKAEAAKRLEELLETDFQLTGELAGLNAKLENDQRFQQEIKNGFCPVLTEKCLNLKEGQTLEGFIRTQFTEVRSRIGTLETEKKQLSSLVVDARAAERSMAALESLRRREKEIRDEGTYLASEKEGLQKELEGRLAIESELGHVEGKITALNDPRSRLLAFEAEAKREPQVRQGLSLTEKNLERLESDKRILVEQGESYKDLDEQWARFSAERDSTADAHGQFLANEFEASRLEGRESEFAAAEGEHLKLAASLEEAEKAFADASGGYDAQIHILAKAALIELQKAQAEARAKLEGVQRREAELAAELDRLNEIRRSMREEFREKDRLEKVAEATEFIRDTLKEAAPRVARNYVYHVSTEANQMFREITGNAERTLKWAEDYGIMLEEGGYDRPFISLSGGEQMSAALAVRLALLKQLSDVRIAFFDEPTTNLDIERRERLAEEVSRITERQTFDQLFVISHDDTFENYADHIVEVGKSS
jgi:exonuclease SbcC